MFGETGTSDGKNALETTVFVLRLLTAVVQAIALYLLTESATLPRSWPATDPQLFVPLLLVSAYLPLLISLGLGQIRTRPLAIWATIAAVIIICLGYHDAVRGRAATYQAEDLLWPSTQLWLALTASLFIAHVLVVDSIIERRIVPSYARHFDTAWKQGVQAALAIGFVGVFWGILQLGAGLFKLVDIDFFQRLIAHHWFAYPATTLALAVSIHVTDVQPSLIRGARSVALTLFSWLLPLLAAILFGFICSLPFISLAPLWKTHFATTLLLVAAGLLVFFINSWYQDGAEAPTSSRLKQLAGTVGSLELIPLVGLAIWALSLRVGQYGWTVDRILAAAIIVVACCYAIGYLIAVIRAATSLKPLETTNLVAAYVSLGLVLLLFTPIADPGRLMVMDQVARLKSGAVPPDKFDFAALKFDGARWGAAALRELSLDNVSESATVRKLATQALAMACQRCGVNRPDGTQRTVAELAARVTVYPVGRTLPADFFDNFDGTSDGPADEIEMPICLREKAAKCTARFVTLHAGDAEAILFLDLYGGYLFEQNASGEWRKAGGLTGPVDCALVRRALEQGEFQLEPHARPDLVVGDERLTIASRPLKCRSAPTGPSSPE